MTLIRLGWWRFLMDLLPMVRFSDRSDSHPAAQQGHAMPVCGYCILRPDGPVLVDISVGFGNDVVDELHNPQRESLGKVVQQAAIGPSRFVAVVNSHIRPETVRSNGI